MAEPRALVLVVLATLFTVGACGGSDASNDSTSAVESAPASQGALSTPSPEQRAAIVRALEAHFGATTAEDFCATVTGGYESSTEGHGAPPTVSSQAAHGRADARCPAVMTAAAKAGDIDLKPATVTVGKVLVQLDRAAAMVKDAQGERPFFLLNVGGTWLVNTFGSAPPDFTELREAIQP
jgi:hypothetical protein